MPSIHTRTKTRGPVRRRTRRPRRAVAAPVALPPTQKVMFTLEPADLAWLDTTAATLKGVRRRTTKSELVRLGLWLLRQKEVEEVRELLRQVD
jgi:hypothetical protein